MSNSIYDYTKIGSAYINSLNSITPANNVSDNSNSNSNASVSSPTDKLDLNSSISDLSPFLNYDSSGQYNSLPSLADMLNGSSNNDDIFNLTGMGNSDNPDGINSLADVLNNDNSDSTDDSSLLDAFNQIGQISTQYDSYLINKALGGLNPSTATPANDSTDTKDASNKTK